MIRRIRVCLVDVLAFRLQLLKVISKPWNTRIRNFQDCKVKEAHCYSGQSPSRLQCLSFLFSFFFFGVVGGGFLVFIWKNTELGFLQGWQGCSLEPAVLLCSMCLSVALGFLWGSSSWGVCRWDPATTPSCEIWNSASSPYLHLLMQNSVGSATVDFSAAGLPGEKDLHPITSQLTKQECWAGWKDRDCAPGRI